MTNKRSSRIKYTNIDKYIEAVNITEHHIKSKLILLRIIIPKIMMKYVKINMDFLVIIIELLRFQHFGTDPNCRKTAGMSHIDQTAVFVHQINGKIYIFIFLFIHYISTYFDYFDILIQACYNCSIDFKLVW